MNRMSQSEVLEQLVRTGRLTEPEAQLIEKAPIFSHPTREIVGYLGGLLVLIGAVRLVIVVFEDASRMSIAATLYVVAVLAGYASALAQHRDGAWHRFGEVLELVTLGAGATATGLLLRELELSGEWSALIPAAVVLAWSLARIRSAQFAAVISLPASSMVVAGTIGSILRAKNESSALPFMVVGLLMVLIGTQKISAPTVLRAIGGVIVLMSSPAWSAGRDGLEGVLPVVAIGSIIFALGASRMWLELIPTSSLVIVISVVNFILRKVDNEVLQGAMIVATGLTVLVGATQVFKNKHPHANTGGGGRFSALSSSTQRSVHGS
ncbi:MAG: hypothetical protein ACO276_09675 [Ilumatobacteraceae bacterium]